MASRDHVQHVEHLKEILSRLKAQGLVLNAEKCQLGVSEIDYLGHRISATGTRPLADRVAAIRRFERPATAGGLQTYLGMVNFYRLFLKDAALQLKPLTDALKGGDKGQLACSEPMAAAFESRKAAMLNAAELAHPMPGAELSLAVDASGSHVGGGFASAATYGRWHTSRLSWIRRRSNTQLLTGSSWLVTWPSNTSSGCWRAGSSTF